MSSCYNKDTKKDEFCSFHLSTYVAVGVLVPSAILLIIALVYLYLRCRQRQIRRHEQQTYIATFIPIYNNEEGHPIPYTYSYPPHYTSIPEENFDKPPPYEQTVREISETNNNSSAILPEATAATPPSDGLVESTKNQS